MEYREVKAREVKLTLQTSKKDIGHEYIMFMCWIARDTYTV